MLHKPFFEEDFEQIPAQRAFPRSQLEAYSVLDTSNEGTIDDAVYCTVIEAPGPGLFVFAASGWERPYPAQSYVAENPMSTSNNILLSLPLSDDESTTELVAPRLRHDGFSSFSPTSVSSDKVGALSEVATLPSVRPIGVNATFLATATYTSGDEFCHDTQVSSSAREFFLCTCLLLNHIPYKEF